MSWRLTAAAENSSRNWTRQLPDGQPVVLGRQPRHTTDLAVPWDALISREHLRLLAMPGGVAVRVLTTARNPVTFQGRAVTSFELHSGEAFRIGNTTFRLAEF